LFAFLGLAWSVLSAQDSITFRPEVEQLFVAGMNQFQSEQFDSAAESFQRLIRDFPRSHRATGSYIIGGKSLYRARLYRESIRLLKDLIDIYPHSTYSDDAKYTLALDYYQLGRYEDAAQHLIEVYEISSDGRLRRNAERMLDNLATQNLSEQLLRSLLMETSSIELGAMFNLRLAEKIFRSGDTQTTIDTLRSVSKLSPTIRYVGDAIFMLERIQKGGVLKVGVLLPLMLSSVGSSGREVGIEFLEGMQLAVAEHNEEALTKVNLEVRDTEREQSVAAKQATELCADDKIVAIVGPISSQESFACAGIANARGVPLITPTGTSNGIAALGPYVFQANPDYEMRGRAMAQYAVKVLLAHRVAVLAPQDAVGKLMADAFIDEAKLLGCELVDVQWYQSGASDVRSQFAATRKKALESLEIPIIDFAARMKQSEVNKIVRAGVRQRFIDSLMERSLKASVFDLFGARGDSIATFLGLPVQIEKLKIDSLAIAVTNIDAYFIPISSSEEIATVSTQYRLYNFRAPLLGTGDWNDLNELDQNRQYADGILFSTDYFLDTRSQAYTLFSAKYERSNKGRKPTVNSTFGYDAMKVLLQTIAKGNVRRSTLGTALAAVNGFEGLHSRISFTRNRVNGNLAILQFKNRVIRKVGEIEVADSLSNEKEKVEFKEIK